MILAMGNKDYESSYVQARNGGKSKRPFLVFTHENSQQNSEKKANTSYNYSIPDSSKSSNNQIGYN